MKFVVVSPKQVAPNQVSSGGPIALYALCKYLAEEGYDARILTPFNLYYRDDGEVLSLYRRIRRKMKPVKYVYIAAKDAVKSFAAKIVSRFNKGGGGIRFISCAAISISL